MKIEGSHNAIQLDAYVRQARQQQNGANSQDSAKTTATGADKVELSSQAREIQMASGQIKELPEVRDDMVQNLKMEIENGTYNVPSGKVATDMLKESFENNQILQGIDMLA
jgi:negative regulator of flagellin synthesis FlgM